MAARASKKSENPSKMSKQKRASEEKQVNSTRTKKNKLFDNHVTTKPSGENVVENIDVINIEDDEESSDSETICRKDLNQSITQPLTSEVPTPSFDKSDDEQVRLFNFLVEVKPYKPGSEYRTTQIWNLLHFVMVKSYVISQAIRSLGI